MVYKFVVQGVYSDLDDFAPNQSQTVEKGIGGDKSTLSTAIPLFSLQKLGVKIPEGHFLRIIISTKVSCKSSKNEFSTKIVSLYKPPAPDQPFQGQFLQKNQKKTVCSWGWPHEFRRGNFKGGWPNYLLYLYNPCGISSINSSRLTRHVASHSTVLVKLWITRHTGCDLGFRCCSTWLTLRKILSRWHAHLVRKAEVQS